MDGPDSYPLPPAHAYKGLFSFDLPHRFPFTLTVRSVKNEKTLRWGISIYFVFMEERRAGEGGNFPR